MDFFPGVLWPLTELLRFFLDLLLPLTGSYGFSIILLSIAISTALSPITGLARRLEATDKARQEEMAPQVTEAKRTLRGRERFERIDEIYQLHGYHPIKSMGSLLPLMVQLPFLLAALFLLTGYAPLAGENFLFIPDLSLPDRLLPIGGYEINVLPVALTAVAVTESWIRKESTQGSRRRFLVVAIILLILIYPFPAGVCLYWLTSNAVSLCRSYIRR